MASICRDWREPICTDDFGASVLTCFYTGKPTPAYAVKWMPAMIAGYPAVPTNGSEEAKAAHKRNKQSFDENERNCNTCRNLVRIQHPKDKVAGFLQGRCGLDNRALTFHPDDPMHMACWQSRN